MRLEIKNMEMWHTVCRRCLNSQILCQFEDLKSYSIVPGMINKQRNLSLEIKEMVAWIYSDTFIGEMSDR